MRRVADSLSTPFRQALLFSVSVHLAALAWEQAPHPSTAPILTILDARLEPVRVPVVAPQPPQQQPQQQPPPPRLPPPPPPSSVQLPSVQPPVPLPPRTLTPVSSTAVVAVPMAVADPVQPSVRAIASELAASVILAAPRSIADAAPWYPVARLDAPPRRIDQTRPVYPPEALSKGAQGWVKVKMQVNAQGVVETAEIIAAQPPGVFDAAVLAFFRQVRYQPPRKDGQTVRALIEERVRFHLSDDGF